MKSFEGKKALIVGIANKYSIAWSIANKLYENGAILGFTFQDERFERRILELSKDINYDFIYPCNVASDEQVQNLFSYIKEKWGNFDILVHSVAFANTNALKNRFLETTREDFKECLDISVYSLISLSKYAEELMNKNSSIITLTYYGSEKVIPNYKIMGVAKSALESTVRYLAYDLGSKKIRVNAISAGAIKTLASSAVISDFKDLTKQIEEKSPLHENITADDVANLAMFLSGSESKHITGSTIYVDSGMNIIGL